MYFFCHFYIIYSMELLFVIVRDIITIASRIYFIPISLERDREEISTGIFRLFFQDRN